METYDHWWHGEGGDQGMEDDHQDAWNNIIEIIDAHDITGKKVLDFGCNQGGFLRLLYKKRNFKAGYGLDIAKEAIRTAQERVGNLPISYLHTSTPADFNVSFDTAISTSVLYLIEDLEQHFEMIADSLSNGGVYYASFCDQTKNPSLARMKEKIDHYGATKMQTKTLSEVVDALVAKGFSVELRREEIDNCYQVSHYKEFYQSVDDLIAATDQSYLIKATREKTSEKE